MVRGSTDVTKIGLIALASLVNRHQRGKTRRHAEGEEHCCLAAAQALL